MSNDIQRFDLIQNYLDGKMSAAERQAFEAQMATDAVLADEVGAHRLEREMMDILLEDDLTEQMQSWQQEKQQMQIKQPKRFNWRIWTMVAIICIGIILLGLYLMRSKSGNTMPQEPEQMNNSIQKENTLPSEQQETPKKKKYDGPVANSEKKSTESNTQQDAKMIALAEEFGGMPEFSGTSIRSGEDTKSRFDSASVLIQEKRYDEAIPLLRAITNDNQEVFLNARLNLGYLYFIKKDFKASIPYLEFAAANKDYLYSESAEWYLLLAYLASGQQHKFDSELATILADPGHSFYKKAAQLKTRLN